jgi:hypothetical protein
MSDVLDSILLERFAAHADAVTPPDFADVRLRAGLPGAPAAPRRWRRRALLAVAIAALVVAGTATAVARHFLGSTATIVFPASGRAIPGLPGLGGLLPVSSAPSPTPSECARAWSTQTPAATRRWAAAQKADGVTVGPVGMRGEGWRRGFACHVQLALDDGRLAVAQGPWTAHGAPRWRGAVLDPPVPASVRQANSVLESDGTIACRLRCDLVAALPTQPNPPPAMAAPSEHVPGACTLLTPAELVDALGSRPRYRTAEPGTESSTCMWHDEPLTSLGKVTLSVQVVRMTEAAFERALSRGRGGQRVAGLGETAYAFRDGALLTVWHRGYTLTVVNRTDRPLESGKRVAAAAIARL